MVKKNWSISGLIEDYMALKEQLRVQEIGFLKEKIYLLENVRDLSKSLNLRALIEANKNRLKELTL